MAVFSYHVAMFQLSCGHVSVIMWSCFNYHVVMFQGMSVDRVSVVSGASGKSKTISQLEVKLPWYKDITCKVNSEGVSV